MTKVVPLASRGLVLTAVTFLLAIHPEGNAQDDPSEHRVEATETTAKKVAKLTAALKDRSYWPDQYRAAEALEKLGPLAKDALPDLITALKDPEPFVRMAAARELGKIGSSSPDVLAALRAAAKDGKKNVRDEATEAYQSLCDNLVDKARKEDIPSLTANLKDTDLSLRLAAARALGKIGSASSSVLVALRAAKEDENAAVREAAGDALARIRDSLVEKASKEDAPSLVVTLRDTDPYLRRRAACALGKVGSFSSELLAALKTATKDDKEVVRNAATEAIDNLASRATKDDEPALVIAVQDPEPFIRRAAVSALGKIDSVAPDSLVAILAATKDEQPFVRNAATEACQQIRERLVGRATKDDIPALLATLKKNTAPFIHREAAVRALGKIGSLSATPEVLSALKTAANDSDPDLRHAATEACENLVSRATRDEVPALVGRLKETDPFIRQAAARLLGSMDSAPATVEALSALKAAAQDKERTRE